MFSIGSQYSKLKIIDIKVTIVLDIADDKLVKQIKKVCSMIKGVVK